MTIQPLERFTDMKLKTINKSNSNYEIESYKQVKRREKKPSARLPHEKGKIPRHLPGTGPLAWRARRRV